jgi:hypothetical protein
MFNILLFDEVGPTRTFGLLFFVLFISRNVACELVYPPITVLLPAVFAPFSDEFGNIYGRFNLFKSYYTIA